MLMKALAYPGLSVILPLLLPVEGWAWEKDEQEMAGYAARDFVQALHDGSLEQVLELCAQPFNFNGRELSSAELRLEWERFFSRNRAARAALLQARMEIIDYHQVVKIFGPPPEKFKKVSLPSSLFAVVRLPNRAGFMLILTRTPSRKWLVAGVAE